ncbi:hypothetical protein, partial [Stenotrophomonas sp. 278]|uniref:hypothetical protein n=1 Tax=Stenotrophomonas sp. 278 TaxID=2479851 RepID=UPI001C8C3B3B
PAGVFTRYLRILSKNLGVGLSAFLRVPRRFRRCEPPIIAGFSASSTPFFEGHLTEVDVVADAASSLRPGGHFVEASRLLCQAFRFRQHLFSKVVGVVLVWCSPE